MKLEGPDVSQATPVALVARGQMATHEAASHEKASREAVWREIYDTHWPWVYRLLRRIGGRDIDPEDATQDVFVAVVRKLPEFEGRAALKTWIYRICCNIAAEHRRRAWRRRRLHASLWQAGFWRPRKAVDEQVLARHDLARMQLILEKLDNKKRQVFVLREIEQLSGSEVAAILDIPETTVRTRLFHARKEFMRLLSRAGVTP